VPINTDSFLYQSVPDLLHERVARHWQAWTDSCQSSGLTPLDESQQAIDLSLLGKIWACSEFVALTMIRHPQLWFELLSCNSLNHSLSLEQYQLQLSQRFEKMVSLNDVELMRQLRLFRQQHMLRIAWRDLAGLASTTETLCNLTDLAECCIDSTLELLYQEQCKQLGIPLNSEGEQQRLVVLGMGKLGGCELNFSSDIDLIFAYEEEGEVSGARGALVNSQFFIRLGQRFIKVLNEVTAEGFVFRVDMRLRPYGESGPLVMSQTAMEQYYQSQGRDWERYAMIKARVVGGDRQAGQVIMDMLKPFVYRRYLDFGAFESIREMKAMIDAEIRRKGNLKNIKLGLGGIREIEFIGQTFQLIRGGSDAQLQTRGILDVLQLLAEKNYLSVNETRLLTDSYDFLRRLENRLQMYADAQTHLLPETQQQQLSMALGMGYADWSCLLTDCENHRQGVHESFAQLLHDDKNESSDTGINDKSPGAVWLLDMDKEEAVALLENAGMSDAADVLCQLPSFKSASQLKSISATGRQRLDLLMPRLLEQLVEQSQPAEVLKRVIKLLQSVLRRSVYLSLLNEYPMALKQLISLCAASPWIAHLLSQYPVLLDELLDPRSLYQIPTKQKLTQELDERLQQVEGDEEQQIERMRKFRQAQVLKIAAMDISGVMDVFEVSEQLSNIAETLLDKVLVLAWRWMLNKHGKPMCVIDGKAHQASMGVVAYGKMGGRELGYGSDLDLVFLHDSAGEQQQTDGSRPLDNAHFFARLAQRIIHLLSVQTANGRLYEIDMRLRPDGNAGMLVSSLQAYDIYQHEKAWTWEHQALIRARMLSSSPHLKTEFDRIRRSILMRRRDRRLLLADIVEMRTKMRNTLGYHTPDGRSGAVDNRRPAKFHLKQDAGGLVDIEFMAQYGVLLHAFESESLTEYTATGKLLKQLVSCNLFSVEQAETLYGAYYHYRGLGHQCALQEHSSLIEVPDDGSKLGQYRLKVKAIWQDVIEKQLNLEKPV